MMIFWRMNNGSINAAIERLELPADDRPESIIDTLYLTTLTRHPSDQESAALIKKLAKELDQRQPEQRNLVWRDLFWALLNCKEFTDHR